MPRRPRTPPERLTVAQARRIALAAQGFGVDRPSGPVTMRHLQKVVDTVGILQIDSVNVLSRSHYLPVFSRLGAYPRPLLERAANAAPRRLVEYWAHEASFIPPRTHRLLRWRMERAAHDAWGNLTSLARERPDLLEQVLEAVDRHGPITAAGIERVLGAPGRERSEKWGWNWSEVKRAVEFLFWAGRITSAGRTGQFERRYALPAVVLPTDVLAAADPDPEEARRELVRIAARAMGVATEQCLRDYFRLRPEQSRAAVADLVEAGELLPVTVDGWQRQAYLQPAARLPRRITARSLLSPFDSLVWERPRTEALWGFRLRLEIYTPAAKREFGYYVLPFLLGEDLVGRLDLKADRAPGGGGRLLVRSAHGEPGVPAAAVVAEMAAELRVMADWLELDEIAVTASGNLGRSLAGAVGG